jgi:monoamine oxidase
LGGSEEIYGNAVFVLLILIENKHLISDSQHARTDSMKRRKFIRTVIAGGAGVASMGLPIERVFSEPPGTPSGIRTNRRHIVREPAHMLRDGHLFPLPPPSEYREVVIVGAGANALVAAYHLADIELVCLEKEPRCGGNSQRSKWRGIDFTEGTAYTSVKSKLVDFVQSEFGIAPTPIQSNIGYIVGKKVIPDFYQTGFDQLPFDATTRAEFYRFRDACDDASRRLGSTLSSLYNGEPIASPVLREEVSRLEKMSFEQWLNDNNYPGEVVDWCDAYCPTDANSYPRNMSAIGGLLSMADLGNYDGSATWPGGLAPMAEALAAGVRTQGANRIRTGSFVVSVVNTADGKHVDVTYLQAGKLFTIRCKTCIWGGQKHIAAYVVKDMPEEQKSAIGKMSYNDISVMNMCYDRRIYDGALISWMNNAPINNILSADWVINAGNADPDSPQVLTCDWTNRPEHRAKLLDDNWVVEQCQLSARRLEEIFPGSIDHLVEIRLPLRAHSWVSYSPGYVSELLPVISNDVGRVVITKSDHNSFGRAYNAGLENAAKVRDWVTQD